MQTPACWELGFQAWAQSTCPELSAQGLVPLRWGCALPSPNARLGEAFPVAVPDVTRLGEAAVVCAVARAVDCVAVLREGPVGRVVAQVTGGPVAVDL